MKKLIALLLCCVLCLPYALATEVEMEETPALSLEEMDLFMASLLDAAKAEGCQITEENGGFTARTNAGDLTLSNQVINEETHVTGVRLAPEQACLRGLKAGDTMDMIFDVYPNDNPTLTGNYYEATLAIRTAQDETMLGYALREGQRVTEVTYAVYHQQADGIVKAGVTYTMDQGSIHSVTLFTEDELLTPQEAETEISDSALLQESNEYSAWPMSENGLALDPFCREDLYFSGMDFLTLTPDKAITVMGAPVLDEWTEDSDGSHLRLMQWDGITLVMKYDAAKQFAGLYSLTVQNDRMEGPRGLRLGDYLDTVLFRFRHSEGAATENGILLYGNGQDAPYGLLSYGTDMNTVSYTVSLDGTVAMLYLSFQGDVLQEMQLFFN